MAADRVVQSIDTKKQEVIPLIDFENPFEDQHYEFFKRYFDFSDKMSEFGEK